MYKLMDYVVEVQIMGMDMIHDEKQDKVEYGPGSLLVTYNNGPKSRFAIRTGRANKLQIRNSVMFCARGQVLAAIEKVQRRKDGEPAWLQAAKKASQDT